MCLFKHVAEKAFSRKYLESISSGLIFCSQAILMTYAAMCSRITKYYSGNLPSKIFPPFYIDSDVISWFVFHTLLPVVTKSVEKRMIFMLFIFR